MKKALNIALILSSLIGYLEWGTDHSMFLFQMEYELLFQRSPTSNTFLHPFVLIPLLGQLLLLFTIFQKKPSRVLTYIGLSALSLLLVFMFFIGIMGMNVKILASTLPFIMTGVLVIRANRRNT